MEKFFQQSLDDSSKSKPSRRLRKSKSTDSDDDSTGSARYKKSEGYRRYIQPPKSRGNVSSDKMQWNGLRSSYPAFAADLEGTMLRLGAGYLFKDTLIKKYQTEGMEYVRSDEFWSEFGISENQFVYDINYLYGLLQSATKQRSNPYLIHHKKDKDGLIVWIKFEKAYAYNGSRVIKSEELEDELYKKYDPRAHKGIADYIDKFQTWMEELEALGTRNYQDADKKRTLLRNLKSDTRLLSLIQICQDDVFKDFESTANYLRENGTSLDRTLKNTDSTTSKMLKTEKTLDLDECLKIVQKLSQESSLIKAYNTLKSPMVRESLKIPDEIWFQLEPKIKERILEIRKDSEKEGELIQITI